MPYPSLNTFRTWKFMWDKFVGWALGNVGANSPMPFGEARKPAIQEPLTLYVETTGNDNNDGSINAPYQTVQAALDWLSQFRIAGPVTVQLGAGTFPGFVIRDQEVQRVASTDSSITGIEIRGTLSAPTLTTGTTSGTVTSNSTSGGEITLTDASQNWTTNELVGCFVEYVNNVSAFNRVGLWPIISNTATSFTIPLAYGATNGVTTYRIVTLGSAISGLVYTGGSASSTNPVRAANVLVEDCSWSGLPTGTLGVSLIGVRFSDTTLPVSPGGYHIALTGQSGINIWGCHFSAVTSGGFGYVRTESGSSSTVAARGCLVEFANGSTLTAFTLGSNAGSASVSGSHFVCRSGVGGAGIASDVFVNFNGMVADNLTTGVRNTATRPGSGTALGTAVTVRGCTTAFLLGSNGFYYAGSFQILGNGTSQFSNNTTILDVYMPTHTITIRFGGGSGNGTIIKCSKGARVQVTGTLTGSTADITMDSANYTFAQLDAAPSQVLVASPWGSLVHR
jgi:hypothetical protein